MPPIYRNSAALPVLLLIVTALVFWPGLSGGFLFDDFPNIVTNSKIQMEVLDWASLKTAAVAYQPGPFGRPMATVSFAINYLIGAKDPWGYKFVGLVIHLVNALLVLLLLKRVLALPRVKSTWPASVAFAIALLWAIHPLQTSSVLYVVQRMEILSTTFVLLALVAYLRGRVLQGQGKRGWPWLTGALALGCLGLLSKENAVLLPAYTLALELTVLGFDARSSNTQRLLKGGYLLGALLAAVIFLFWALPAAMAPHAFDGRNFDLQERLLTQLRVLPLYLGQILLPLPGSLTFYYDAFPKSTGLLSPATTLAGGALVLALLAIAWRMRRCLPLVSLGILWFFGAHLLTSNVFNLELVFEHRNYFAMLGILLAVADLIRRIPMRDGPALKQIAVVAVILAFGAMSLIRSATWGNSLNLALDLVHKAPASARASNDLGEQYMVVADGNPASPFYAMGIGEFERGSRLPDASPLPEQALILFAASMGQPVKEEWWQRFIDKLRTRPIGPQEQIAVSGLIQQRYDGIELDDRRLADAYIMLASRVELPAHVYARLGDHAVAYLHDEALADQMFIAAIEQNPTDSEYAAKVFASLTADGRYHQAEAVLERARALGLINDAKTRVGKPAQGASL